MVRATGSWSALFRGPRAVHTLLLILGIGVHAMSVHLLTTVLPSVVADIGGAAYYAWAMMLFTTASIMGTACGGVIKAAWDLRLGYLLGSLIVLAGVLGCALAPHMAVFLGACALQGSGCGLLVALAYGMVSELYPPELRPRVLSAGSGMWGVAALVGPTMGGVFAGMGWWRGAFWWLTPGLGLLSALAWYALPAMTTGAGAGARRLPVLRLVLLGSGVVGLALSGRTTSVWGRLGLIVGAGLLIGHTFRLDRRAAQRLFPAQSLGLTTVLGTAVWMFICFGICTSQLTVFLPLVVQVLHGVSPLQAGYFTAVLSLAWTVTALASAHFHDRHVRVVIVLGPLLMACGTVALGIRVITGPLLLLGCFLALVGAGIGLCFAHLSSWTIAAAPSGESTLTASAIPTIQSLGIAFGAAAAGMVANAAGVATGISPQTVTAAASWVYGVSVLAPTILVVLAMWFLWLRHVGARVHIRETA